MATKKIIGYDYSGHPVYEAEIKGIPDEQFARDLDLVVTMPDGKDYFDIGDDRYYAMKKDGAPDMSRVLRFDPSDGAMREQ